MLDANKNKTKTESDNGAGNASDVGLSQVLPKGKQPLFE